MSAKLQLTRDSGDPIVSVWADVSTSDAAEMWIVESGCCSVMSCSTDCCSNR